MTTTIDLIRTAAEKNLTVFAKLVNPSYEYAEVHEEGFDFLSDPSGTDDRLLLLPREHLKSHMVAVWCAWHITNNPATSILYVSATDDLATLQLSAIKAILTGSQYRKYWPEMVNAEEAKRKEWNNSNICVDHPLRTKLGIRDRTVAARSAKSNTTGLHCEVLVFDDLVVPSNAYTNEGRQTVAAAYSQFSSVASTGAISRVVGTRYHGKDIYNQMLNTEVEEFDEEGNVVGSTKMYSVMQRSVEADGVFLWPRKKNEKIGKFFGFNPQELAKKRAKYFASGERAQYYAQYYNNPNDPESEKLTGDSFQYYDRKFLREDGGEWYFKDKPLSIFAAGDLAYTDGPRSDFTAFAVIGLDTDGFIYLLELYQFKTTKYDEIYKKAFQLHEKWHFKKLRMETNAGANLVVEYMKDQVRKEGATLVIEGKRAEGEKLERCSAILRPRYENKTIWHYQGAFISEYEEQVTLDRPTHDDLRDAVSAAVEISKPPRARESRTGNTNVVVLNARFGGRGR